MDVEDLDDNVPTTVDHEADTKEINEQAVDPPLDSAIDSEVIDSVAIESTALDSVVETFSKDEAVLDQSPTNSPGLQETTDITLSDDANESSKKYRFRESEALSRLTQKKPASPDIKKISSEERKHRADELRKQKVAEQSKKGDSKRDAVLERKRRLDEEERLRKEALFRKLTQSQTDRPKLTDVKKRYSASYSNLSLLHKKKSSIEVDIDLTTDSTLKDQPEATPGNSRPSSAMGTRPARNEISSRPSTSMGMRQGNILRSPSTKTIKPKVASNRPEQPEIKRPMTAMPTTRPSTSRLSTSAADRSSTMPRPSSAMGSAKDRRSTLGRDYSTLPTRPKAPSSTTSTQLPPSSATQKSLARSSGKSKSTSTLERSRPARPTSAMASIPGSPKKPATSTDKSATSKPPTKPAASKGPTNPTPTKSSSRPSSRPPSKAASKEDVQVQVPKPKSKKKEPKKEEKGGMTEEEAKKALAERRKKAKEEAEEKARLEREKDIEEQKRLKEEDERLAEEARQEAVRQATLMEEHRQEEEQRIRQAELEKEQREIEEKQRQEEEQKQRDAEIERKAKIELDKKMREQEKMEQEQDAERIERKKRVEMIMNRVSTRNSIGGATGSPGSQRESSKSPPTVASPSNEADDGTLSARSKVDSILRSKGLGRSLDDLLAEESPSPKSGTPKRASPLTVEGQNGDSPPQQLDESYVAQAFVSADINIDIDNLPEANDSHIEQQQQQANDVPPKFASVQEMIDSATSNDTASSDLVSSEAAIIRDAPAVDEDLIPTMDLSDAKTADVSLSILDASTASAASPIKAAWEDGNTVAQDDVHDSSSQQENHATDSEQEDSENIVPEPDTESSLVVDTNNKLNISNGNYIFPSDLTNGNHLQQNGEPLQPRAQEAEQWNKLERTLNGSSHLEAAVGHTTDEAKEASLWKVAEGQVELGECF